MTFEIRVDFGLVIGISAVLVLFGVGYNQVIALAERRGYIEGFTSQAVALGTLITLAGAAIICWQAALITLLFFVASGIPMIIGSTYRYARAREVARQKIIEEASHGNQSQGVA